MDSEESDEDEVQSSGGVTNGNEEDSKNANFSSAERINHNHGIYQEGENSQTQSPLIERSQKFKKNVFVSQPSKKN